MKKLKSIGSGFLKVLLVNLICLFLLSCFVKEMFLEIILNDSLGNKLMTQAITQNISQDEKINELLENKKINKFINNYIDETLIELVDDDNINEINIEEDLVNLIEDNRGWIEEKFDVVISDDDLNTVREEAKNINEQYSVAIERTKASLSEENKKLLQGFNYFTSFNFKIIVLILSVVIMILIAIIQRSFYMWIKTLGSLIIASGGMIFLMSLIVKVIVNKVLSNSGSDVVINMKALMRVSIITMIIGIVIVSLYSIVIKIFVKGLKKNEISEIS